MRLTPLEAFLSAVIVLLMCVVARESVRGR